jgi:single-strand DNA-binding protein
MHSLGLRAAATRLVRAQAKGRKQKGLKVINQITIVGFLGRDAQKKALPNGTPVLNFSLATKKVWKDSNNEWQERTQWHQVVCFGDRMAKLAERLVEGTLVYVQGELTTRDRERTIKVPNGSAFIEHVVKQLEVEVKADVIRILDRRPSSDGDDTESETEAA